MPSFTTLCTDALLDLGCLRPGQSTSPDVLNACLRTGNRMIDSWLLDELLVFTNLISTYSLVGGTQTYTIGPNEVSPNFTAARPTRIDYANLIINTTSPSTKRPIQIITDQQNANIRVPQIPFALPLKLYYDGGFDPTRGFASIFLWPGPLTSYQLELYTWQQLQTFADLTTVYKFAPGYELAVEKNLAVAIAPMMDISAKSYRLERPRPPLLQLVQAQAMEALERIRDYNAPDPILEGDPAFASTGGGSWNYAIGESNDGGRDN